MEHVAVRLELTLSAISTSLLAFAYYHPSSVSEITL